MARKKQQVVDMKKALRMGILMAGYNNMSDFAISSGIGKNQLSLWVTGVRKPNLAAMEKAATALDMKVSEFIALGE